MTLPAPRVLLVQNEIESRRANEFALSQAGFVVIGRSYRQALKTVLNLSFDVMILCVSTPSARAEELYRRVRQTPRIQTLPILVATGDFQNTPRRQVLPESKRQIKPLITKEFILGLRSMLRRSRGAPLQDDVIKRGALTMEL